ncbi:MAG: lysophospholipid acyltransferase family protein [Balneolaceae bacterium]|nr:lysophospholipid acyltransferase family protein [Balneolaceae bacterium]
MAARQRFTFIEYLRSALSILLFFILLLIFTPFILAMLILSFGKLTNFVIEKIAPFIAKAVLKVAGIDFRIKMHVDPIPAPAVYIVNHSSTLDILTILALGLPRARFVAKWQLQYNPIFFILGHLTGQVFIRREHSEKAVKTLQKSVDRIKKNDLSIMLAPEGSRKHRGIIGPFKKGPFRMAMDLDYPIVPIYFEGNRELSAEDFLITKSGTCTAHIHPAIDTSEWTRDKLDIHIYDVRNLYIEWAGVENDDIT